MELRDTSYFRRDAVYMLIVILGDYRRFVYAVTCIARARARAQSFAVFSSVIAAFYSGTL